MSKRRTPTLAILAVLLLVSTVASQAASAPHIVSIIDRDGWISEGATDSLTIGLPGQSVTVCLWIDPENNGDGFAGAFDFLICYNNAALAFLNAYRGADLHSEWEYFTWRTGHVGDSCSACPEALVRVIGIADLVNPQIPSDEALALSGCVAEVSFIITGDWSYVGSVQPVAFCAFNCGDNIITSVDGDSAFIPVEGFIPGDGYDPGACVTGGSGDVIQNITFRSGGIVIYEPQQHGDINLNGISHEVSDAVLYSRFMTYGPIVFDTVFIGDQIAESDMNCDSLTMTLEDVAFLWNIIQGDLQPCEYPLAFPPPAGTGPEFSDQDSIRVISTAADAGDTITIDFYVRNVDTLNSLNFRLLYDPAVLEPIISDTVLNHGDTALTVIPPEQLRDVVCEFFGAGISEPGVLTFLASDLKDIPDDLFLPDGGPTVRTLWRVLPSATPQVSALGFEDDPAFPNAHNTMVDRHAAIWKRPVMTGGYVNIGGALCECPVQCDYDADGFLTALDLGVLIDVLFTGLPDGQDPDCPAPGGDFDCDLNTTALDLSEFIDHLFAGAPGPCNPCAP